MADATADITEGAALQQFILLAKKAKGKACAAVIMQALSAPGVFVFGELLEMANVQALSEGEDKATLELLKIFSYGTYSDYKAAKLATLTPQQAKKLQQLTIVSLAAQSKAIPYDVLQKQLDIKSLRELEDLIIDAIYQGLFQGQLDQRRKQVEIEFAMGRDLKPDSVDSMMRLLQDWSSQSQDLLKTIKEKIQHANFMSDNEKKHREEQDKKIETVKQTLKAAMDSDLMQSTEFEGMEGGFFGGDGGKKGGRGRKGPGGGRDPHMPRDNNRRNF